MIARITGLAALGGGLAWALAAAVHSRQPVGCVGDSCSLSTMREATALTGALVALAGALILVSGVGLLVVVRRAGRLRRTGAVGAGLALVGLATLALAVVVQAAFFDDSWSLMPWFVGPGVLALAAGAVLVGWNVLRSGLVPAWAGAAVIVGALLLVLANEQTTAVLLAVPFGVAWAALGASLAARSGGISPHVVR